MIRTALVLNGLSHEEAYLRGWQDHADSLELAAEGEAALQASRAGHRLEAVLDRIYGIAPYEVAPVEVSEGRVVPFDWAEAA